MSFWRRRAGGTATASAHTGAGLHAPTVAAALISRAGERERPAPAFALRRTYLRYLLLVWIFAAGYLVGYVHHGQLDKSIQHEGLLGSLSHRPLLTTAAATGGDDPQPSAHALSSSFSRSATAELLLSVLGWSSPSGRASQGSSPSSTSAGKAASPASLPSSSGTADGVGGLPVRGSFCSITATNMTSVMKERYRRFRERAKFGAATAIAEFAKLFNKSNVQEQFDYYSQNKPPATGYDGISAASLKKTLSVSQSEHMHTISCNHFEFYCMNHKALVPPQPGTAPTEVGSPMAAMSEDSIKKSYEMQQIIPMFYPNLTEIGSRISGNNFARMLGAAMAQNDWKKLDEVRRGNNIAPPEVGLIYDAYVTKQGTIFNPIILIEAWPDTPSRWSDFIKDYLGVEGNATKQKWRDVDQVVVLTHTHQNMFWHWMVSEAYRLLLVYRFLLENPDIYIHIWGGAPLIQKWHDIFGIDKSRFISEENVRAKLVYYVQAVDRSDVPSVGFITLIRHHLHDLAGIPLDSRVSQLLPPTGLKRVPPIKEGVNEVKIRDITLGAEQHILNLNEDEAEQIRATKPEVVIKIALIIRDNPNVGRMINNYKEMMDEIWKIALVYPLKAIQRGHNMRIVIAEHPPKAPLHETWRLFGTADIIIGPHGAGFVNLFATRPGARVIEFVAARHLNILTTSRLGIGYHGVLTNMTSEGTTSVAKSQNYVVDVPFVTSLIQDILDERFP